MTAAAAASPSAMHRRLSSSTRRTTRLKSEVLGALDVLESQHAALQRQYESKKGKLAGHLIRLKAKAIVEEYRRSRAAKKHPQTCSAISADAERGVVSFGGVSGRVQMEEADLDAIIDQISSLSTRIEDDYAAHNLGKKKAAEKRKCLQLQQKKLSEYLLLVKKKADFSNRRSEFVTEDPKERQKQKSIPADSHSDTEPPAGKLGNPPVSPAAQEPRVLGVGAGLRKIHTLRGVIKDLETNLLAATRSLYSAEARMSRLEARGSVSASPDMRPVFLGEVHSTAKEVADHRTTVDTLTQELHLQQSRLVTVEKWLISRNVEIDTQEDDTPAAGVTHEPTDAIYGQKESNDYAVPRERVGRSLSDRAASALEDIHTEIRAIDEQMATCDQKFEQAMSEALEGLYRELVRVREVARSNLLARDIARLAGTKALPPQVQQQLQEEARVREHGGDISFARDEASPLVNNDTESSALVTPETIRRGSAPPGDSPVEQNEAVQSVQAAAEPRVSVDLSRIAADIRSLEEQIATLEEEHRKDTIAVRGRRATLMAEAQLEVALKAPLTDSPLRNPDEVPPTRRSRVGSNAGVEKRSSSTRVSIAGQPIPAAPTTTEGEAPLGGAGGSAMSLNFPPMTRIVDECSDMTLRFCQGIHILLFPSADLGLKLNNKPLLLTVSHDFKRLQLFFTQTAAGLVDPGFVNSRSVLVSTIESARASIQRPLLSGGNILVLIATSKGVRQAPQKVVCGSVSIAESMSRAIGMLKWTTANTVIRASIELAEVKAKSDAK